MKTKIIFLSIVLVVISVAATWYYIFVYSKNNHRKIDNEIAIPITAVDIVKEYETNEKAANAKYLNKAVQVTGIVTAIDKNQDGFPTITLQSQDTFSSVYCTLKSIINIKPQTTIIVKGICIGFTTDVKIKDAIIIKQ
ncbi:MAG: hypothetical protein IM562_14955 [Chitinophagaceae bacterium]|nr:hypothetical protein [Chitinophagaceae bacterium]MCA6448451.1 hypothetical protein [Chitinophagaceae bacterium]